MGAQVVKNYSGLLHNVQLWVTTAEFGAGAIMFRLPMLSLTTSGKLSTKDNKAYMAIT